MNLSVKRAIIGKPIPTALAHHEKLPKILALPVFASDALSSVAYASEEIMAALLVSGAALFTLTPWLSLGIVLLLAIVATSYRQTVMAYPNGGGAYIVARENLGEIPAQTAGAALLIDYILTVSVSVAAGIDAIVSLLSNYGHDISHLTVPLCILSIIIITVMNLRGVRESGAAFAIPTYTFVAVMYLMLGIGIYKLLGTHTLAPIHTVKELADARVANEDTGNAMKLAPFGIFLLLHAFASGCTALTGVEAISNGVTAFKEPSSKNAATTMVWMAVILGSMFLGLSYLAVKINALPPNAHGFSETVLSQVGRTVFGTGPWYLVLQIATCLILILAANTSFADFPRLCSLIARDGFLPRQLANIGDKLVFNNGIFVLALLSALLVIAFKGDVHLLIPLYAVGVFLSFTLSQGGMVKHWFSLREPGWKWKAFVNGMGAVATFIVLIVFGIVKFAHGAWVVIILVPVLVMIFFRINGHYRSVAQQLSLQGYRPGQGIRHHVLVLVPDIHRGVIPALQYARSISPDAKAIHVSLDPTRDARIKERWTQWSRGLPLVILDSPYRSLVDPIMDYITLLQDREENCQITVVVPEFMPTGWWAKLLHGQAGVVLLLRLRYRPGVAVTNIPYHIKSYVRSEKSDATRSVDVSKNGHY